MATKEGIICIPSEESDRSTAKCARPPHCAHQEEMQLLNRETSMIDAVRRKNILLQGKPQPREVPWWGEPNFGGWYTEAEIEAAVNAIRSSMHWSAGFGHGGCSNEIENCLR
jgi:hypothetical protein